MTVRLVLGESHLKTFLSIHRVRKQAEETALTCLFMDSCISRMMQRLWVCSVGLGIWPSSSDPHLLFHRVSLHFQKMRTSVLSVLSLRQLFTQMATSFMHFLEPVFDGRWVVFQGKHELGVVSIGDEVESVAPDYVGQGCRVYVE